MNLSILWIVLLLSFSLGACKNEKLSSNPQKIATIMPICQSFNLGDDLSSQISQMKDEPLQLNIPVARFRQEHQGGVEPR
ncbi:MAG: hypothetical protein VKL41_22710 [Snowella sp.]|nr:hypothetical protein [Snowella sp.]